MSKKKLTKDQKRKKIVAQKRLKKQQWEEHCAIRLVEAAHKYSRTQRKDRSILKDKSEIEENEE